MGKYKEVNLQRLTSFFHKRYKVSVEDEASTFSEVEIFDDFFSSLPNIGKAKDFVEFAGKIIEARKLKKPIIFMCGAHIIKTGCAPILIELMKRGFITHLAVNGAFAIHDVELSIFGHTSEYVEELIQDGSFGVNKELADFINQSAKKAYVEKLGYGEALGKNLVDLNPSYLKRSVIAWAYKFNIPCTVHVAIGTDIVHQFPSADGGAIGDATFRDFKIFVNSLEDLNNGGVVLNWGSAVIMPEVFLKALNIARNIFKDVDGFITANFDMIAHYRPLENVVKRPSIKGKGYSFIGHHEIMLPLLAAFLLKKNKN